jgi:histidine triad (HIT) family protein
MGSVFSRIMDGELPGHFVWKDATATAFLSINPIETGHTLVVPRVEVDHWLDVPDAVWQHCTDISRLIGRALQERFDPPRVAMIIAGFDVPHTHIHLIPAYQQSRLSFAHAADSADASVLAATARELRDTLTTLGFDHGVS